jgi:alanine racemase
VSPQPGPRQQGLQQQAPHYQAPPAPAPPHVPAAQPVSIQALHVAPLPEGIPAHASSVLTIDLDAIRTNYRALRMIAGQAQCAGVIKADAYGLGLEPVLRALLLEQCRVFFVANVDEAWRTRQLAPEAVIYVLNGLFPGAASAFIDLKAQPVLGSVPEIEEWAAVCAQTGQRWPAAVHVDTGMNRLGITPREAHALQQRRGFDAIDVSLLMSHLSSADSPGSKTNAAQRHVFDQVRGLFPKVPASLANSAATLLGPAFHYDVVRPGIAVYGGRALQAVANPMKSVVRLLARIIQIREAAAGETIGYGQTFKVKRPSRIAIIAAGYADGLPRAVTNGSVMMSPGISPKVAEQARPGVGSIAHVQGFPAPIVGRVSMDLIALDVTDLPPDAVTRGAFAELIGRYTPVDDVAAYAETIGYEVLTRLSRRAHRVYLGG